MGQVGGGTGNKPASGNTFWSFFYFELPPQESSGSTLLLGNSFSCYDNQGVSFCVDDSGLLLTWILGYSLHCPYVFLHVSSWTFFFFFFFGHPTAYEVPGPGIRSEPQVQPKPQLQSFNSLCPLCQAGDGTCILGLQRCYQSHHTAAGSPSWTFFLDSFPS